MIVIVESPSQKPPYKLQAGVALLQVLLISAIISLLAVRFTYTAQDQIEMASQIDKRVKLQLKAKSVLNEVVFSELSTSIKIRGNGEALVYMPPKSGLNRYGAPIGWGDGVSVEIQDLNGLLPQIFVGHSLWEPVLRGFLLNSDSIVRYIGTWSDMQDKDINSWDGAGVEPPVLGNGGLFINDYAQNSKVLEWVFSDQPEALNVLLDISDVNAPYETSLVNSPKSLLSILLEPEMADAFAESRQSGAYTPQELMSFLPDRYMSANVSPYKSNEIKITVKVDSSTGGWLETQIISLTASSKPPFKVIVKH